SSTGLFTTIMAGYSHGIGVTPATVGSGPIADISVAWGGQGAEAAGYLRLHARFGIGPDNPDYRAIFLSAGFELRLDPRTWCCPPDGACVEHDHGRFGAPHARQREPGLAEQGAELGLGALAPAVSDDEHLEIEQLGEHRLGSIRHQPLDDQHAPARLDR